MFEVWWVFSNHITTDLLFSLLVKQFLKSVSIWRSYRQEVTNHSSYAKHFAAIYIFFCVTADAYSHTMGIILIWPLCISFS